MDVNPVQVKLGRGEFHEHPLVCICAKPGAPPATEQEMKVVPGGSAVAVEGGEEIRGNEGEALETADEGIQEEGEEATKEEEEELPMVIEEEQVGEQEHDNGMQVISLEGDEADDWGDTAKE